MLPVIDSRLIDEIKLPESKQIILLKPYKTSQEKIILQSIMDKKNRSGWFTNIKAIVSENSVNEIDLKAMSTVDFLYLCLKLRSISKGDAFEYSVPCSGTINKEDDKIEQCNHVFKEKDTIDSLLVVKNSDKRKVICDINPSLSLELTTPRIAYLEYISNVQMDIPDIEDVDEDSLVIKQNLDLFSGQLSYCVTKVIVNENGKSKIYNDFTPEEVKEKVILNLTLPELKTVYDAKHELISLAMRIHKVCPKCKTVYEKEDADFFEYVA